MAFAFNVAELSSSTRLKVGAVLVKGTNILSFGWNGTPTGFNNCCELSDGSTDPMVIHAEVNTLAKIAKSTISADGSTLYLTDSPCFDCCKLIIQSGIKRVVYKREYRINEPIKFMEQAGIEVIKLS